MYMSQDAHVLVRLFTTLQEQVPNAEAVVAQSTSTFVSTLLLFFTSLASTQWARPKYLCPRWEPLPLMIAFALLLNWHR